MRVAAVDLGTNSTRLLVADLTEQGVIEIERRVMVTGLGRGVDSTGLLTDEGMADTLAALAEYGRVLGDANPDRARAVATAACREAANAVGFLDRAQIALGLRPEVVDGDTEAELGFRGAATAVQCTGPCLVVDPGGGSTEFVFGSGQPESVHSVGIGSVRLTERVLPDRPAERPDVLAAAATVTALFEVISLPGEPDTVIGVGGTFTSLAAIALDLPVYDRNAVHGAILHVDVLGRLVDRLAGLTIEETAAIPSLDPARAPVLLGGAVIAEAAVRRSGRAEATVSERDILDGIALSLAD